MRNKIGFFILVISLVANMNISASTAGHVDYDSEGNIIPVQDPIITPENAPIPDGIKQLPKKIVVDLSEQTLSYYYGDGYKVDEIKISSGLPRTPTPTGTFTVLEKVPVKEYVGRNSDGSGYDLPNTLWNLKISPLGYFIHGAYWHNNFGHPMSHGCINVSYTDMPALYNFADIGTAVIIHQ